MKITFQFDFQDADVDGLPIKKWKGTYSHVTIDGTDKKVPAKNALSSVDAVNFPQRYYMVMVADDPDNKTTTGDQVADLESQCRRCKLLLQTIFK